MSDNELPAHDGTCPSKEALWPNMQRDHYYRMCWCTKINPMRLQHVQGALALHSGIQPTCSFLLRRPLEQERQIVLQDLPLLLSRCPPYRGTRRVFSSVVESVTARTELDTEGSAAHDERRSSGSRASSSNSENDTPHVPVLLDEVPICLDTRGLQ